jgi:hypothetical protein
MSIQARFSLFVILVLGTRIHEFRRAGARRRGKFVDGRGKPDHDEGGGTLGY